MSSDLDRRAFIRRASMGAAAAGALAVTGPGVFGTATAVAAPDPQRGREILDGSDVLAHVVNARTGEISILVGTSEIHYVNRDIAQQLLRASQHSEA